MKFRKHPKPGGDLGLFLRTNFGAGPHVLAFPHLTWEEWQVIYREDIRIEVEWDRLGHATVGRQWITALCHDVIYFPWYMDDKSWHDGEPKRYEFNNPSDIVMVVPALLVRERHFLLLDGCHRVRDLRPRVLILDYIEVEPNKLCMFADMLNPYFRLIAEGGKKRSNGS